MRKGHWPGRPLYFASTSDRRRAGRNGGRAKSAGTKPLVYVDGKPLTLAECAAAIGLSERTVESRYYIWRKHGPVTLETLRRNVPRALR